MILAHVHESDSISKSVETMPFNMLRTPEPPPIADGCQQNGLLGFFVQRVCADSGMVVDATCGSELWRARLVCTLEKAIGDIAATLMRSILPDFTQVGRTLPLIGLCWNIGGSFGNEFAHLGQHVAKCAPQPPREEIILASACVDRVTFVSRHQTTGSGVAARVPPGGGGMAACSSTSTASSSYKERGGESTLAMDPGPSLGRP